MVLVCMKKYEDVKYMYAPKDADSEDMQRKADYSEDAYREIEKESGEGEREKS